MRAILKGPEPASLTAHRLQKHANFDNYKHKDDLRQSLVTEQRGLCSYCMSRIRVAQNKMKIEHWQSQSQYPDEQLNYRNLLAGCLGNDGQPGHLQHCDTRKGDRELVYNPANPNHHIETRLVYEPDGTIRANEQIFDQQLNDVLNLNLPFIKRNRESVLSALLHWWRSEKPVSRRRLELEIEVRSNGAELTPYCQVAVWWLRRKLTLIERK